MQAVIVQVLATHRQKALSMLHKLYCLTLSCNLTRTLYAACYRTAHDKQIVVQASSAAVKRCTLCKQYKLAGCVCSHTSPDLPERIAKHN